MDNMTGAEKAKEIRNSIFALLIVEHKHCLGITK